MEPAFPNVWEAVKERRRIEFDYRRRDGLVSHREIEPWGILSWHGAWYLVGRDLERKASRVFRLSRLTSEVIFTSTPAFFKPPEGLDLRGEIEKLNNSEEQIAVLNVARKPIGVFLMVGTSGTGKTETAMTLADLLYGGEQNKRLI